MGRYAPVFFFLKAPEALLAFSLQKGNGLEAKTAIGILQKHQNYVVDYSLTEELSYLKIL